MTVVSLVCQKVFAELSYEPFHRQNFVLRSHMHIFYFIFYSCEQNVTQTTQFLKMDFNVPVFILTRSVTADRHMTSQLKWDGGLGLGNRLFLCHNDTVPQSHNRERGGFDWHHKKRERTGPKSPHLEIAAH